MLPFNEQYNVLHGVFITFSSDLDHRLLLSKHKGPVRDRAKSMYSYSRFETWTRENLVLAAIMIMLENKPASFYGMFDYMGEDLDERVKIFREHVLNYRTYIRDDVELIKTTFGEKPPIEEVFKLYTDKKIKFYTLWWFSQYSGCDMSKVYSSRIMGSVFKRLKQTNLFLTYKSENLKMIQDIMTVKLDLDTDLD